MHSLRATPLLERARTWTVGADPGLLRLQTAARTTLSLLAALLVLFGLTTAAGQPLTVALLGAVVAMVSARAVNEPDPRRQRITLLWLPLPAALAITAAALLAPHRAAADIVFVVIIFAAVYARRFAGRGAALGMVAFMTYFFTLFLHADIGELPWLVAAVAVGTLCSFVMSSYLLPERPDRVLRRTVRSLRARMAIVVDTAADVVRAGRSDERARHRLAVRVARLNETALMAQSQLEDKVDPAAVWPGVRADELTLRLFDAELTVERVAAAAPRAATAQLADPVRAELAATLHRLGGELRGPDSVGLHRISAEAQALSDAGHPVAARRLAMAVVDTAAAVAAIRALPASTSAAPAADTEPDARSSPEVDPAGDVGAGTGLRPTTRQAIQVAVAAALAIVAGELVSPDRWYWAVIATFVTFAGTASWGETLTKGWQRLAGTILGVPSGVLIATLVDGDTAVSVLLVFVCLFCAFYLMKVSYAAMIFWITTMLALMYGLLGQFSVNLLLVRIEETAIGTVIGVTVALLVLPSRTGSAIREAASSVLAGLSGVVESSAAALGGAQPQPSPTRRARDLHHELQEFRVTAKPMTVGIAGVAGRGSVRRGVRLLKACDHYARTLARASEGRAVAGSPRLAGAVAAAAAQTRHNIDALAAILDRRDAAEMVPDTDVFDAADALAADAAGGRGLPGALHALRQIDRAVVDAAADLGAGRIRLG